MSNEHGRFVYVSPSVVRLLGRKPEELLGKTMFDFAHPDDRAAVAALGREVAGGPGRTVVAEARASHADGGWRWLEATSTNLLDEPNIEGFVSNFRDITEHKRTAVLDAAATRALEAIAQGAPLRATLTDLLTAADTQLSDGACALRLTDPAGTDRDAVAVTTGREAPARWCVPILASDTRRLGVITVHSADERPPDLVDIAIVERIAALAAVAVDRSDAEDRLEHQAFHDPLTGLPNRTLLLDRLGQALLRLARSPGEVAVLFLDIDRFKVINDSLGHDAGDELLVEIARRIERCLQAADTVARFGGDEFVVVCERLRGRRRRAGRAQNGSRARWPSPSRCPTGASWSRPRASGSRWRVDPHDRPRRSCATPMPRCTGRRSAAGHAPRSSTRPCAPMWSFASRPSGHCATRSTRDELRVLYQPTIRLADGELVGAEALLRWRHPARGLIGAAGVHRRRRGDRADRLHRRMGDRAGVRRSWRASVSRAPAARCCSR